MKLVKTNERWDRPFNNGVVSESRLESVQYNVTDNDGNSIGNANISLGNASANVNLGGTSANISLYGFSSIEEGEAKMKELFGITD